jgi:hypothetical protein
LRRDRAAPQGRSWPRAGITSASVSASRALLISHSDHSGNENARVLALRR